MRARFMPVLCEEALPWSLWMRFELEERDRLLAVLQFQRITAATRKERLCEVIPTPAEEPVASIWRALEAKHRKRRF